MDHHKEDQELPEIYVTKIMNDRQKLLLRIPEGAYVEAEFTKKDELHTIYVEEINSIDLSGFRKLNRVIVDSFVHNMYLYLVQSVSFKKYINCLTFWNPFKCKILRIIFIVRHVRYKLS